MLHLKERIQNNCREKYIMNEKERAQALQTPGLNKTNKTERNG